MPRGRKPTDAVAGRGIDGHTGTAKVLPPADPRVTTDPPEGMPEDVVETYWRPLAEQLRSLGVLQFADVMMLAEACSSLAESARYRRQLDRLQDLVDEALDAGDLDAADKASAQLKRTRVARNQALIQATKLLEALGLTPVGRMRLGQRAKPAFTSLMGPSPNDVPPEEVTASARPGETR